MEIKLKIQDFSDKFKKIGFSLLLLYSIILSSSFLYADNKKNIHISKIHTEGVPHFISNTVRSRVKLNILENFGDEYYVLSELDIQMMSENKIKPFDSGCKPISCLKRIINSIQIDEIIYGKIIKENDALKVSLTNFHFKKENTSFSKKSIVSLSFPEDMYEYYIREVTIKLLNPDYVIENEVSKDKVSFLELTPLDINKSQNLDSSILDLDCNVKGDDLRVYIRTGDQIFYKGEHAFALTYYQKALKKLQESQDKQHCNSFQDFEVLLRQRIILVYDLVIKSKVADIDKRISANEEPEYEETKEYIHNYSSILRDIPEQFSSELVNTKQIVLDRVDNLWLFLASKYEKKGDIAYKEFNFETEYERGFFYKLQFWKDNIKTLGSLQHYENALNAIIKVQNKVKADKIRDNLLKKIERTKKTGENSLSNTVNSLIRQSEYLYRHKKDVASVMERARELIINSIFSTDKIVDYYNKYARILNRKLIDKSKIKQSNIASFKILL